MRAAQITTAVDAFSAAVISNAVVAFGNPFERPAEQVLRDVTSGYVSVQAAWRDDGVVTLVPS
jgi:N-methylhydantoinase B/oxoprolinase/acetone carboxylase alpha subunit